VLIQLRSLALRPLLLSPSSALRRGLEAGRWPLEAARELDPLAAWEGRRRERDWTKGWINGTLLVVESWLGPGPKRW
jgi:hypothetical protein